MKNIAHTLCMIFLFGIYFPTHQAYANGKKAIAIENSQSKITINDDLVNKLVNSKTFEKIYNQSYFIASYNVLALSVKSSEQLKEISEYTESKDFDATKYYNLLGYNVDNADLKDIDNKLKEHYNKLLIEIPEIKLLSSENLKINFETAIIKADLQSKAAALLTKDDCYKKANDEFTKCVLDGWVWKKAALIACAVCIGAVILCTVVIAVGTAGAGAVAIAGAGTAAAAVATAGTAGTAAAVAGGAAVTSTTVGLAIAEAFLPLAQICVKATFTFFGATAAGTSAVCNTGFTNRYTSCLNQFGQPAKGAE